MQELYEQDNVFHLVLLMIEMKAYTFYFIISVKRNKTLYERGNIFDLDLSIIQMKAKSCCH